MKRIITIGSVTSYNIVVEWTGKQKVAKGCPRFLTLPEPIDIFSKMNWNVRVASSFSWRPLQTSELNTIFSKSSLEVKRPEPVQCDVKPLCEEKKEADQFKKKEHLERLCGGIHSRAGLSLAATDTLISLGVLSHQKQHLFS